MAQILVLVDHIEGSVRKTTTELLTIARRLGEPAAAFIGAGFDNAAATLAEFGAVTVYRVEGEGVDDFLVVPKVEALANVVAQASPAAVLIPSSPEGKEIAARLAVTLESGLITDAVDVVQGDSGPVATQSVFAGAFAVTSRVTTGIPIITVKPNSTAPQAVSDAPSQPEVIPVEVTPTELALSLIHI